jgi:AcrR family transcriptional regulator
MNTPEAQRRRQILEAAERLLRHYGPAKTTIAEIAREAAVGVGTVYLEFASKDAILEELSSSCHAGLLGSMRDAASGTNRARYAERLCAVIDARVEGFWQLADRGTHAPDLVMCGKSAVRSAHARFQVEEQALLVAVLRDGTRAREFAVTDPEATAAALGRVYASFAPPWLFAQPRDEARRLLRAVHELVLNGLLARPATRRR